MEKIKAAIIGLGRIASLLEEDSLREKPCTHAGAITLNESCVLCAGCDNNEKRRLLFAEKWQVPVFENAGEMIKIHKPQILVIATHPDSHYHYCKLAASCGVPVIICEKPLADNVKQARKIAKLCKGGVTIITNHERRYSQDYIKAKSILEEGKLGKVLGVTACLYMGKHTRLVDQIWHDGTHLADAVMFLSGRTLKHIKRIGAKLNSRTGTAWLEGELLPDSSSMPVSKPAKPSIISMFPMPSIPSIPLMPIPVLIEIGAGRDHLVFEIEFSCEKGRLRIGNGIFEIWESSPSPYAENFRSLKLSDEKFTGVTGYFANMVNDAVSCVIDRSRIPCSAALDGLRVVEYLNSVKHWH